MKIGAARRIAWVYLSLIAAILVAAFVLGELSRTGIPTDEYLLVPFVVLGSSGVGALIFARQPENRIGWIFAWNGAWFAIGFLAGEYTELAIDEGRALPAPAALAWLGMPALPLALGTIPLIFLLFPTGRVPTSRWRPVLWCVLAAFAALVLAVAVTPGRINAGFSEPHRPISNPIGLPISWSDAVDAVVLVSIVVIIAAAFLSVLALVLRYRRSSGDELQQVRWLAYVGALVAAMPVIGILIEQFRRLASIEVNDQNDVVANIWFTAFFLLLLVGIPAACGIAILKYRLYDLDLVIKKTVVFAVVVVLLTAIGGGVGVLVGTGVVPSMYDEPPMLLLVGIGYGLLAIPLYRVAKRIADRVVYGGRASPYEVITEFSERVGETYSAEDVLPRMAQILLTGTGARTATVWLRVGGVLRPAATAPEQAVGGQPLTISGDALPGFEQGEHAVEVRHQGELLGALTARMPANDPMNPSKERLVRDLASQAGLVLRNVRLIEELRESRRRLVTAQDEERRKLERNIHDGAQQQLVALAVKQRLAENLVRQDPEGAAAMLAQLQTETSEALENLRDLARGIYPQLLADQGLAASIEAQARKAPLPVEVEADATGRYPQEIEAAVYFCCLEALQNVAKYAGASKAAVQLTDDDGWLTFTVTDDGAGFDPTATALGTGLQGIADRLEALGGAFEIRSQPGEGTTLTGRIPARTVAPGPSAE